MLRARPPIIIDIEASGFGAEGYPIEIGVAFGDGTKYCSLVTPMPGWNYWDAGAEKLHGVSRSVLEQYGKPVAEVAARLNELLGGRTAYTDGWVVDKPWLNRLYFAAGIECTYGLSSLEMILSEPQMEIWHATKNALLHEMGDRRHRASFDAYVVQETWERTRNATASRAVTAA